MHINGPRLKYTMHELEVSSNPAYQLNPSVIIVTCKRGLLKIPVFPKFSYWMHRDKDGDARFRGSASYIFRRLVKDLLIQGTNRFPIVNKSEFGQKSRTWYTIM